MHIFANRQTRSATLAKVALAFGLFAAPGLSPAHAEQTVSPDGSRSVAVVQSDADTAGKTDTMRALTAREKGFGRRGGDK